MLRIIFACYVFRAVVVNGQNIPNVFNMKTFVEILLYPPNNFEQLYSPSHGNKMKAACFDHCLLESKLMATLC